jgi:hypothetical protein
MVVLGLALIGFQFSLLVPADAKSGIADALEVLDIDLAQTLQTQETVNAFVFGGLTDFYQEFYVASTEVFAPVTEEVTRVASNFSVAFDAFAYYSEALAQNYNNNYVASGVEADGGGRVLGSFILRLPE